MEKQGRGAILLGVTGCIAAYKACELLRNLQKEGAQVKVIMTESATQFVGQATFHALTSEPVYTSLFDPAGDPVPHINLAREADVFLIAPCTGDVLNKLANGIADDLLTSTALATTAPLVIAPAMNVVMFRNAETQASLDKLRSKGAIIVEPAEGMLACGEEGEGKLAEVEEIAAAALEELDRSQDLVGKKVLVTAGPTQEPLDPVRYLGNRSSGRTGYLIAAEAARRGAQVVLVSGPVDLKDPFEVETVRVGTALEMQEAVSRVEDADIAIFTAAVADYRPAKVSDTKLKKGVDAPDSIQLILNPDILAGFAKSHPKTFTVGFAAETGDPVEEGKHKLASKGARLIVANDVSDPSLGFGTVDNKVWLITDGKVEELPRTSKGSIARILLDTIVKMI